MITSSTRNGTIHGWYNDAASPPLSPKIVVSTALLLLSIPAFAVTPCTFGLLPPTYAYTAIQPWEISAGDVNGDGHVDAIVSNTDRYSVLLGNAAGGFEPYQSYPITTPRPVVVADFNGDHLDDFVMGYGSGEDSAVRIFISNGNGTFAPNAAGITWSSFPWFQNPSRLVVDDFNGDGKLDVAISGTPGVVIAAGDGQGGLTVAAGYDLGLGNEQGWAVAMAMADFNQDGKNDLVVSEISRGLIVFISNGNGTFVQKPDIYVGGYLYAPFSIMAGDFDGDGHADILFGSTPPTQPAPLKLYRGNGNGTFQAPLDKGSTRAVRRTVAVDIDHDGDLDFLMDSNEPLPGVMINDGAGNFTSLPFDGSLLYYPPFATPDVDHDGSPDVLLTDYLTGRALTMLNRCGVVSLDATSSPNPSDGGSDVTITATVTSPPGATATGSLTLKQDGSPVATGNVPSIQTSTADLAIGTHAYVAAYSGDARFYPATKTLTQTVQTAPFGPPPRLRATATSTTSVSLTWFPILLIDHYEIQRGTSVANLSTIGTSPGPGYADGTAAAGNAYVYRVRGAARAEGGPTSPYSNLDLASTFTFTDSTLTPQVTPIKAAHVTQLREAIDAARVAAGIGAASWTDSNLVGVPVKALHLTELRTALDQARSALGMASLMYTDPMITAGVTLIRATHFDQLRAGLQ